MATITLPTRIDDAQVSLIHEQKGSDESPLPLLDALMRIDKYPLDPKSVVAYKAAQIRTNKVRIGFRFYEDNVGGWSIRSRLATSVALSHTSLTALIVFANSHLLLLAYMSYTISIFVMVLMLSIFVASAASVCESMERTEIYRVKCKWIRTPFADYDKPVPLQVLQTAMLLNAVTGVQLEVDYLHSEQKVLLDPFLIARLGDEEYEVEVWDEPNYEAYVSVP